MAETVVVSPPPWPRMKRMTRVGLSPSAGHYLITALGGIAKATQSSMNEALKEAMQANIATREKVVVILNFMTLDFLPFSLNSFQVVKLTSSMSGEATTNVGKDKFVVVEDTGELARIKNIQPSLGASPVVVREATIAQDD